jgi:cation diffusion facilitator CzcD-associated flavoprotein CzcO
VIGGGPVGLAAAAHLLARGETPLVLEAGVAVGASIREWSHVRFFSPWTYTVDAASVALLEPTGWTLPDSEAAPTGAEIVERYLEPLAALPEITPHLRLNTRVTAIARRGHDKMKTPGREHAPFVLRVQCPDGTEDHVLAKAVIDASGTWRTPNPLGADGLPALGEAAAADRIGYGIPDVLGAERKRYAGKRILVVGSGHSAFNALLDLADLAEQEPATEIT